MKKTFMDLKEAPASEKEKIMMKWLTCLQKNFHLMGFRISIEKKDTSDFLMDNDSNIRQIFKVRQNLEKNFWKQQRYALC